MGERIQCCGCQSRHGFIGENNMLWFLWNVKEKDGLPETNLTWIKKPHGWRSGMQFSIIYDAYAF
jgi:hypothetical protein